MSKTRIGLMGFGEIGRDIYRLSLENPNLEVVAISDLGRADILHYLLRHDGRESVEADLEDNYLVKGDNKARIIRGVAPADVPWDAFGVDVVVDSTHKYRTRDTLQGHLDAGAGRVILSTIPYEPVDRVAIMGVNCDTLSADDKIVSAGSSTTNVLALMLKMLDEAFGVEYAMMTAVHAYTSDQPLRNTVGKYFRRSRSAAKNIIPNVNYSAQWVGEVMPKFKGKIQGAALNVPVPLGSLLDLTTVLASGVSIEEVNAAVTKAAEKLPNIVQVTEDPIVSSDVIGNTHTVVFDTQATMKSPNRMIKTLSWYDNSLAQASRIIDLIEAYDKLGGAA